MQHRLTFRQQAPGCYTPRRPAIAEVLLLNTRLVMVFDRGGRQLPRYQGRYRDVRARIRRDAGPATRYRRGTWRWQILSTRLF